jgi:uncharacterized protein (TIGR00297 family)
MMNCRKVSLQPASSETEIAARTTGHSFLNVRVIKTPPDSTGMNEPISDYCEMFIVSGKQLIRLAKGPVWPGQPRRDEQIFSYSMRTRMNEDAPDSNPGSGGESKLTKVRSLTNADLVALASAAALLAVFVLLRRPELPPRRLLVALAITAGFAGLAWLAHGVNFGGALAGSAIAFILAGRDIRMFLLLLVVFALVLGATRLGARRKQQLRTAEPASGRSASQVMANLGMAGLAVALAPTNWPILALAALAEAVADTSSSELGMAFPAKTVLITSGKPVPPGVDGGISFVGTLAGLVSACLIALAGWITGLVSPRAAAVVAMAGFLGTMVDSLLGALVERRGWLNNDLVNLVSTASAAVIATMLV